MTSGASTSRSAITLRDGRVLVCGGSRPSSCDLFDPTKGTFTATGPLAWSYSDLLVLNQLADGSVLLIAGGSGNSVTGMADRSAIRPGHGDVDRQSTNR